MVDTIDRNQRDQELEELVKWLSPLDFGEKHNMLFEKRARDTGEWFLKDSKFLAWRRGDTGYKTLWCPGNPGVGKSVMISLVINELGKVIPENAALVFIYFEYKTKYTLSQLAEVILKQLARRRITRSLLESLQKHKTGIRPTSDELFDMLKIEVETYDRVLVVIDALDEADVEMWTQLLGRLQALRKISLIATSRDTGEIEFGLRPCKRLDITANEGDMKKYIEGRLESSGKFKRLLKTRRDVHEEIVAGIMNKADGMFLLVRLHMNSLETKLRVTDLRQALVELPDTLDATYDEAMSRISNDDKALAYRVISWLVHAAQPMTIRDLQYALAVEDGMTAINNDDLHDEVSLTSICVGLVVLREDAAPEEADHHTSSKVVGLVRKSFTC
ncbi:hypothetical protein BD779DRAFT_1626420 [Infundibulicybe gibba]|nr:hypothetical protein BD779DRAFT_1626420 [Infundibulicybe gibba]